MEKRDCSLHMLISPSRKRMLQEEADKLGISVTALVNICITKYFEKIAKEKKQ